MPRIKSIRGARVNLRFVEVVWCGKPVFVSGISLTNLQSELGFQIFCQDWLNEQANKPGLPLPNKYSHWHHSAGENRGSGIYGLRAGLMAKRSGQQRGWPDWINCHRKIAIELKLPKGVLSEEQKHWLSYFKHIGFHAECVRSFERFVEVVEGG
jgi:hypothetical protein